MPVFSSSKHFPGLKVESRHLTKKTYDNTRKDDLCCEPISRVDWCKICAVCDESMISGMTMHHTIANNFFIGPSNVSHIKVARGGYCALL